MCLDSYGLDACHYFSAPGLGWDSALRISGVKFEFFESSIRDGISQISLHHPEEPLEHLYYTDANNFYGLAMSDPLPTGGFRWLTDEEIERLDIHQSDVNDSC